VYVALRACVAWFLLTEAWQYLLSLFLTNSVSHYYTYSVQESQVFHAEKSVQATNHLLERENMVGESAESWHVSKRA
jgi:hypothetical protein